MEKPYSSLPFKTPSCNLLVHAVDCTACHRTASARPGHLRTYHLLKQASYLTTHTAPPLLSPAPFLSLLLLLLLLLLLTPCHSTSPSTATIHTRRMPAKTEKNPAILAHARTLTNTPWCDDYEKMVSGVLYLHSNCSLPLPLFFNPPFFPIHPTDHFSATIASPRS